MLKLYEGVEGEANLKILFKELNSKYFGGAIPNISIKWSGKLKNSIGRAHCMYVGSTNKNPLAKYLEEIPVSDIEINMKSLKITIAKNVDFSMNDLKAVLLHEMVHIFLYTKRKLGNHHDSPEFQNWIKKLSSLSGLTVPMREAEFKKSPKIQAKESFITLIWDYINRVGACSYTKNFIEKKWMEFGTNMSGFVGRSSKIMKIEVYKVKHSLSSTLPSKRSFRGLEFIYIDENDAKEVQRGKQFFYADKQGGILKPYNAISVSKKIDLKFDNRGRLLNRDEIIG